MLDRALGALPPDCAALLHDYLKRHPEAAGAAAEIEATAGLARKALARPAPTELPAFPPAFSARIQQHMGAAVSTRDAGRFAGYVKWVSGLAAAVLIGFGAHAFLYTTSPAGTVRPATALVAAGPRTAGEDRPNQEGFWSARRLYERAAQGRSSRPEGVIWDSPVRIPRVGDQT